MPDLALNDSLIDEYINYKFQGNYNSNTVRKLFKYIQTFALRSDNTWMSDPSMPLQLESDPLIEVIDTCSDIDLVQNTLLKFMITDSHSSPSYKIINLNNSFEKIKLKYGATYPSAIDKDKAQEHIKFLLSDADWIQITDGYIATPRQWSNNKTIISNILPLRQLNLKIIGADKDDRRNILNEAEKQELIQLSSNNWSLQVGTLTSNMHDRYIETDKVKILLSSGLEHLSSSSNKDFTYIVDIK